jgi:hypothetical protein
VSLARDGDLVWLAWSEGPPDDDTLPRTIRLAAVDLQGDVAIEARDLATEVVVASSVHVSAGPDGPVVVWGRPADLARPPGEVGAGTFFVHHERRSGPPETTSIETTAFAYGPGSPAVELVDPRGVVVAWAANVVGAEKTGVWMDRLDCR